jgi:signal transduction histidine kinase
MPVIEAESNQMLQLMQNLIANSLKFKHNAAVPQVGIRAQLVDAFYQGESGSRSLSHVKKVCEITVKDNGIGFDESYLDRIFTPFQRLHGRSEYGGVGMGLAICRKIVERHGGTISARSAPDRGATFIVTLPVTQESNIDTP